MKKCFIKSISTLILGACLATSALAQDMTFHVPKAIPKAINVVPGTPEANFDTRTLSLADAGILLTGVEGPAWTVLEVLAPACTSKKAKECKPIKKQCDEAQKFAKKYGKHATCSELYTQTSVLLAPTVVANNAIAK